VIRQLDQTTQKYLALGIFFGLIILLIMSIAVPVWKINGHYSDNIDEMIHRITILKRTTVEGKSLAPQYEKLKNYHLSDKRYLKSKSEALAAAEIQQILKDIIVTTDGEVLSTQLISNKKKDPIPQITLKVRLRSNLNSLVTILHKIETGNPYLFIEDLNIRSRRISRRRTAKDEVRKVPIMLDVQFNVSGYIRGDDQ
jgi:general secretion pathway protein M